MDRDNKQIYSILSLGCIVGSMIIGSKVVNSGGHIPDGFYTVPICLVGSFLAIHFAKKAKVQIVTVLAWCSIFISPIFSMLLGAVERI